MKKALLLAPVFLILVAGCSQIRWVSAGDPVLGICQSQAVDSLDSFDNKIDSANATNPEGSKSYAIALTTVDQQQLAALAAQLSQDAAAVKNSHLELADDLLNEAGLFKVAAGASDGFTTNSVAVSTDGYTRGIQGQCGSFQVASAAVPAKPGKPGPGLWDWALAGEVLGAYLLTAFLASFAIARYEAQKIKQASLRHAPLVIAAMSLIWPAFLGRIIVGLYLSAISRNTFTILRLVDRHLGIQCSCALIECCHNEDHPPCGSRGIHVHSGSPASGCTRPWTWEEYDAEQRYWNRPDPDGYPEGSLERLVTEAELEEWRKREHALRQERQQERLDQTVADLDEANKRIASLLGKDKLPEG